MKTFLAFITESKSATLYHGTEIDNIHKILKSGKIKASRNGEVSTTRDKHLNWGNLGHRGGGTFHLDQEKIAHRQKITPTDWHSEKGGSVKKDKTQDEDDRATDMKRSESEESVKGHISLKHAHTLSLDKDTMHSMSRPKTEHEKHIEDHPNDPDNWLRPATATSYKDRMKKWDSFKKLVAKRGLKLISHG
jgi:hypothetical protein